MQSTYWKAYLIFAELFFAVLGAFLNSVCNQA